MEVGPFCVVGPDVRIGPGCRLISHVTSWGGRRSGRDNVFYPNCVIGGQPQDLKYQRRADFALEIGDENQFREAVTLTRARKRAGA